jgi:membrane fusion protein, copper/silver efflux system
VRYDGPDVRSAIIGAIAAVAVFAVPLTQTRAEGDAKPMAMPVDDGHAQSSMAPTSVPPPKAAPPPTMPAAMALPAADTRKVLYYRNPVGLPDVSPTPKRDLMGLDYLPVYEGEEPADPASDPLLLGLMQPIGAPKQAAMPVENDHAPSMAAPKSIALPTAAQPATKPVTMVPPAAETRRVLYYRNPMGLSDVSPTPKKDSMGMDYVPVYEGGTSADPASIPRTPGRVQPSGEPAQSAMPVGDGHAHSTATPAAMSPPAAETRRVLYYRNPMGLSDVSPTPKKDSMGMDYVPVYEGEGPADPASVRLTPGRIQRSGVRTQAAEKRVVVTPVHGFGALTYDESAIHTVTVGLEGTVDELFVHHVGEKVRVGQPLFRIWSNQPQLLQIEVARRARGNADQDTGVQTALTGGSRVLNRSDWPSPATGVIVAKRVFAGQHVVSTDELLRIADPSRMWVIVDIAERDVTRIEPGQKADVVVKTGSAQPLEGTVLFIYPEIKPETRTARVCLAIANPRDQLKAAMYADVTIRVDADKDPVVAVPESAIIDDGERRHVLIDQGDGHFAPRTVVTGAKGQGYTQILSGVAEGEMIVTSANFLIDSEANIDVALAAFAAAAR